MADPPTDPWLSHFQALAPQAPADAPVASGPSPAAGPDPWTQHFQALAPQEAMPPPPSGTPPGGLWPSVKYIGQKAITGALATGSALVAGNPVEAGLPAWGSDIQPPTGDAINQLVFGRSTPEAPNTLSRYAGSVAEAAGGNPVLATLAPAATVLGGLGGEAGSDLTGGSQVGRFFGGLLGGSAAGLAHAAWSAATGANTIAKVAGALGDSETYEAAGTQLQSQARDWLSSPGGFKAEQDAIHAPLNAALHQPPMAAGAPMSGVPGTQVTRLVPGASGAPGMADQPRFPGDKVNELAATPPGPPVTVTETTGSRPKVPGIPQSPGYPSGPPTPIPEFTQALDSVLGNPEAGAFGSAMQAGQSSILGKIRDQLRASGVIPDKGTTAGGPRIQPWDAVAKFSSWLGEQISNPKSYLSGLGDAQVKTLYSALQADRATTAQQYGLGQLFSQTQAASAKLFEAKEALAGLVEPGVDPAKAARLALASTGPKGGSQLLGVLRDKIPESTDELAAGALRVAPRDWTKMAPEAKAALVPDPVLRQRLTAAVEAQLPPQKDLIGNLSHELVSGSAGEMMGALAHGLMPGGMSEIGGGAAGGLAGLALPYAMRGAAAIARNPALLRWPGLGALAAGPNELLPGPTGAGNQ